MQRSGPWWIQTPTRTQLLQKKAHRPPTGAITIGAADQSVDEDLYIRAEDKRENKELYNQQQQQSTKKKKNICVRLYYIPMFLSSGFDPSVVHSSQTQIRYQSSGISVFNVWVFHYGQLYSSCY